MSSRDGSPESVDEHLRAVLEGRLERTRRLGRGGMAIVYEAYDRQSGRPCAIKVLRPELSRSQDLVRFKREYRTALRLRHPSCVEVYDQWLLPNCWFYSMQLFSGGSLATAPKPLPVPAAIRVGLQVLSALDYVHARNVVHRDVKPGNVLVDDSEYRRVALADFGIAQVADLDEHLVGSRALGSPRYIAPETAEHGVADPRADLYALGVLLYELLSGRHPYEAAFTRPAEWKRRIRNVVPEPLEKCAPNVPRVLGALVMRLLEKEPANRPRTAAHAFEALTEIAGDEPMIATLPALLGRPYLAVAPLIGRHSEIAHAHRFIRGALGSDGPGAGPAVLSMTGAAGSGKSRLLAALVKEARSAGATVLSGQCREETGTPFRELRSIVNYLADGSHSLAHFETHPPLGAFEENGGPTTSVEPSIATLVDEPLAADDESGAEAAHRFATRRAVESLLARARTDALLIVMEDVQWIGSATAHLFAAWVRAVAVTRGQGRPARVAFVVTSRTAEDHFLGELDRELQAVLHIEVPGLNAEGTAQLVAALLGETPDASIAVFSRQVFPVQQCTPLFVRQVLQLLLAKNLLHDPSKRWDGRWRLDAAQLGIAGLPSTLAEVVGDRAARLSVETQVVLSMAAVGGRRFALPDLCSALEKEDALVMDCLDEAERANLIAQDVRRDREYVFIHDRHRESIYEHLAVSVRAELHILWAEALLRRYGGERDFLPDLAHHFAAGAQHVKAHEYAVLAADAALVEGAFSQAAEMYRRAESEAAAAGISVDSAVWERRGDACLNAGLYVEAEEYFHRRLAHAEGAARDTVLVKLASLRFRGAMEGVLSPNGVLRGMQQALEGLGVPTPKTRIESAARAVADNLRTWGWMMTSRSLPAQRSVDVERRETLIRACLSAAEVAFLFEPQLYFYYASRAAFLARGLEDSSALGAATLAYVAGHYRQHAKARRFAARAGRLEPKAGLTTERAMVRVMLGSSFYVMGDLAEAEAQLARGHALVEASGEPMSQALVLATLSVLMANIGKTNQARRLGVWMLERGELLGLRSLSVQGRATMCLACYYDGDHETALEWAEKLVLAPTVDEFSRTSRALLVETCRLEGRRQSDPADVQREIENWRSRGIVSVAPNYVLIGAIACIRAVVRTKRVNPAFVDWLATLCRRERLVSTHLVTQTGIYLAVVAARDAVLGRRRKAVRGFERAVRVATKVGVMGDARLIERLSRSLAEASYL